MYNHCRNILKQIEFSEDKNGLSSNIFLKLITYRMFQKELPDSKSLHVCNNCDLVNEIFFTKRSLSSNFRESPLDVSVRVKDTEFAINAISGDDDFYLTNQILCFKL